MDLERVAAVIRPRSHWEAIDLGFGMVRTWWRPVWSAWLVTVAPAWCLLFLLLSGRPGLALFLLWWLRPLFDRVPLFVVSRCLFGAPPPAGAVLQELPRLWGRDLLAALTVQRLDPARSFHLPVGQLEGLRGAARQRRLALLNLDGRSHASWLTAGCSLLELAAAFALLEVIGLMSPQPASGLAAALQAASEGDAPYWLGLVLGAVLCGAFTILEPFYVAAGFSLYLGRRTRLEGWDVEIAFRRLAGRLAGKSPGRAGHRGGRAVAAVLVLLGGMALAAPLCAFSATDPDPQQAIREVLARPEFQTKEKVTTWQLKGSRPARPQEKMGEEPPLRPAVSAPTELIGVLAVFAGAVIVVVLLALARQARRDWRRRRATAPEQEEKTLPETVFGLDIRPESLPPDVAAAAWSAWEKGEPAAALGLLYRGALACLVRRDGLDIEASWTEGDCLAAVRRQAPRERADYFDRLTRAWQSTAYAHRAPAREDAQALCAGWSRHFRAAEQEAA